MTARLVDASSTWLWLAFVAANLVKSLGRRWLPDRVVQVAADIFFEIKPFALPLLLACHLSGVWAHGNPVDAERMFHTGIKVAFWLMVRNEKDDDDRWKHRRRKTVERVQQVGARLVVVPAGAR